MTVLQSDRFDRVDAVFDAIVDLPIDEQTASLDRACGDDHELRAEVLQLLREYRRSDSFLDSPAAHIAGPILDAASAAAGPTPEHIGPFRIVREIGRGGMGRVFLGERADGQFEQRVAIKLIQYGTPGIVRRFVEERRILALLEHPGIARLVDGGITDAGLPYFAMELVDGVPIDRYCDTRNLTIDQRLDLFASVCDAVTYAHSHLIIHRDLKPSNILVTADGTPKLLDFGIAKLLGTQTADDATRTELQVMTPEFAAPEQVRGTPVNTSTDVYALGVLLYKLLAADRPYEVRGKSPAEIERIVCTDIPPKPSVKAPAAAQRRLRGDLDLIVMTALQKQPERRYQSPAALAQDLQRFTQGRAILARPDSARYRLGKFVRRNRTAVAFSVATAMALLGATGFSVVQMREAQTQRTDALRAAQLGNALAEIQTVVLGDSRDPNGKPLDLAGRIAMAEGLVTKRYGDQPWLVAWILVNLSGRHFEAGDIGAQRAMLGRARQVALAANALPQLALANCVRASSYWLQDVLDSARADVDEAKAAMAREKPRDKDIEVQCLEAEGKLLQATGQPDSGIALLRRAVSYGESGPASEQYLGIKNSLAELLRLSGRTREAVPIFRSILADLEALGYGESESFPNVANFLTTSLLDIGEYATYDSTVRRFLREREALHGEGRVPTLLALQHARGMLRLGALDSADLWLTRAMQDTTQGAGQFQQSLSVTLTELRLDQGRIRDARIAAKLIPAERRGQRATAALLRARLLRAEGDARAASALLEKEMTVLLNDGHQSLTWFALPVITAGEWRLAAGDARGADSLARVGVKAAAIDSIALTRSALAGRGELLRARALRALNDASGARDAAQRAITALANGYGPDHSWTRTAKQLADSLH